MAYPMFGRPLSKAVEVRSFLHKAELEFKRVLPERRLNNDAKDLRRFVKPTGERRLVGGQLRKPAFAPVATLGR